MDATVKAPRGDVVDVPLRFGAGTIRLRVPRRNVAGIHRPTAPAGSAPPPLEGSPGWTALRREAHRRRVLVLVADGTRTPADDALLTALFGALIPAAGVIVGVATGSHRADTPANAAVATRVAGAAARAGAPHPRVFVHDAQRGPFRRFGTTSAGTPVELAAALEAPEVFVVVSDVKPHYFAGYSNPLKYFLPGVAAFGAIEGNHRLTLEPGSVAGRHPLHPDPARRDNPLAADMLEAFQLVVGTRPAFAAVTVRAEGRVVHAELGDLRQVTARAFAASDALAGVAVAPAERLVVSAGGAPQDATLYLAQRALELTKAAALDGAEILLLAECAEGIADNDAALTNFYDELTHPVPEVLARIREGYRLYRHKAYRFAELCQRTRALHLASRLEDAAVRAIHLEPAPDPQRVVDRWVAESPDVRVLLFDEANRLFVQAT